jgi:hypothetical protein
MIRINGEIVEADIINLSGFTLWNNILKWGENFLQYHPNYALRSWNKHFRTMKNDEEIYMHLKNLQQQFGEWVEV